MNIFRFIKLSFFPLLMLSVMVLPNVTQEAFAGSDFFIYPKMGQSSEQQEKDEFACYKWARGESGFDPMVVPMATAPPPAKEAKKGGVARGMLGGAAVGAVVGDIRDDDPGKGAATGAIVGGLFGGMRRQKQHASQQQAEQQWAQEQSSKYAHGRDSYNRAYAACLEAREYTVK
jgi:hypothetical protein